MKFNTPDSGGIKHVTSNPDHQYFAPIGFAQNTKRYSTPLGSLDYYITQARMCDSDGIELARLLLRSEHPEFPPKRLLAPRHTVKVEVNRRVRYKRT